MKVGILCGTGFDAVLRDAERVDVDTAWGPVRVAHRREGALDLFLVDRHGERKLPAHRIVHRANVDALVRCGVDAVLALASVGALVPALRAPSLLVPDDLLDLRRTTETFHDEHAVHVDLTEPYCPALRALLAPHADAHTGTYVAVEGPRLETRAEVRMMRELGGAVVGMTGAPEAALARERALCYASLCLVVNAAAGVHPEPLRAADIRAGAEALAPRALDAVLAAARAIRPDRACVCRRALDGARL